MGNIEIYTRTSGLQANMPKSEVYCSGIKAEVKHAILTRRRMREGVLPFGYLGIPLDAKRLSAVQYQPLLERMLGKINHWSSRLLSYGGRLQLVRSVLYAVQNYWCQVFVLPKKVMKAVEGLCRKFLWTGSAGESKKGM